MGRRMIRPAGSAIRPRIPASCEMGPKPPLVAPELAMVDRLPCRVHVRFDGIGNILVVRCQMSITRSLCSCSVSRPRRKVALHQSRPSCSDLVDDLLLFLGNGDIGNSDGGTGAHGIFKTNILDPVSHIRGLTSCHRLRTPQRSGPSATFIQLPVDELDLGRQDAVEDAPAQQWSRSERCFGFGQAVAFVVVPGIDQHLDLGMNST